MECNWSWLNCLSAFIRLNSKMKIIYGGLQHARAFSCQTQLLLLLVHVWWVKMSQYIFQDHFKHGRELSGEGELSNIMFPDREPGPVVVWRSGHFCRRTSLTDCPCQIAAEWPWLSVCGSTGSCHSFPAPLCHVSPVPLGRLTSSSVRLQRPHSRIKHTVYLITDALKPNKRAVSWWL